MKICPGESLSQAATTLAYAVTKLMITRRFLRWVVESGVSANEPLLTHVQSIGYR